MNAPQARRLFVGLAPEPQAARELAADACALLGAGGFRLTAAQDLHLTLVFFGAVAPERLGPLAAALRCELAGACSLRATIANTGAFPRPGRERVLWAGLRADAAALAALEQLAARCERAARAAGLERPEPQAGGALRPHLTLARVGPGARTPAAFHALTWELGFEPREARLYGSRAGAAVPRYAVLERFELAVPAGRDETD